MHKVLISKLNGLIFTHQKRVISSDKDEITRGTTLIYKLSLPQVDNGDNRNNSTPKL